MKGDIVLEKQNNNFDVFKDKLQQIYENIHEVQTAMILFVFIDP